MADKNPHTEHEIHEQSLSNVRDALAALQSVPAASLDTTKHETLRELVDGATSLERVRSQVERDGDSVRLVLVSYADGDAAKCVYHEVVEIFEELVDCV